MVRERTYCVKFKQCFVAGDPNGSCKKYGWQINMRLAGSDKVCSYDSFKNSFFNESPELIEVLSPLGDPSYITRDAFERGKEVKGEKTNFWRVSRKQTVNKNYPQACC